MQTLSSLITGYLETDEYEKQLSPDTIKAYRIEKKFPRLHRTSCNVGVSIDKVVNLPEIAYLTSFL